MLFIANQIEHYNMHCTLKLGYIIFLLGPVNASISLYQTRLVKSENKTEAAMQSIFETWEVDKYPNFLKSCSMTKHSWDIMKLKFRRKIIMAEMSGDSQNFTICFGGSSVTAGHDSPFNLSFSVLTGPLISDALIDLGINVVIRSVALGNNPCYPYDLCAKTFCGGDADIVHWEQSYFCGFNPSHSPTLEQFIRQSFFFPSRPIIVFAESSTPNW